MTEDEWFEIGARRLTDWRIANDPHGITNSEADAFEYGWELAGEEMGIVK